MTRPRVLTTATGSRTAAFGPTEWGLLAAASLIWGSSFIFIAEGLEVLHPFVVTWVRVVLGAAALSLFPKARAPIDRSDWPTVILLALVWMALPMSLFSIAQQWIDSALAVQGAKAVLRATEQLSISEALDYGAVWNAAFLASNDLAEAIAAFVEKRAPNFSGD